MNGEDSIPPPKFEREDANPRLVAAIAGSLALLLVLGLAAGYVAVGRAVLKAEASLRGTDGLFQHGAQAKTDVDRAWKEIDRSMAPGTDGYSWVDRRAGIVRVPIDRAIDLVCAEQGSADLGRAPRNSPP